MKNGIWIADEIWQLDWPPMYRIFLAKVMALSKHRKCNASDDKLAEYLTCKPQYIRKMMKELREAGCLVVSGHGNTRSLAIGHLQNRSKSNHSSKQPQLQSLQPQAQIKATTVATKSNHSCVDYRDTIEKTIEGTIERKALLFPYESSEFMAAWNEWLEYRMNRRLPMREKDQQLALHKLHEETDGNERMAINAIATAIASGWTGIFPSTRKSRKDRRGELDW